MSDRNCVKKYDRVCIKIDGESQVSFQEKFCGVHYSGFLVLRRSLWHDLCHLGEVLGDVLGDVPSERWKVEALTQGEFSKNGFIEEVWKDCSCVKTVSSGAAG
ncbi:hypothetical protein F2Q68_00001691 [Brassica cretica]|uniref:Uncharacterized protein n=1 Tax=Brassica cretica TaxID=69181 RepID=A0A8S9J5K4_BRACR|nr:hypothetical protein F2Q68_00001691 [Brassica cretica]